MYRKSIAVFMLLVLLTVFAGCNTQPSSTPTPEQTAVPRQDTAAGNTTSVPETQQEGVKDYGTIYMMMGESYSQGSDIQMVAEHIKGLSGVLVEPVYTDGQTDKFTLMIASNEDIDTASAGASRFLSYINNGSIMALDDLLEAGGQNIKARMSDRVWEYTKKDGKIYALPTVGIEVGDTVQIRKDWLEEQGLSVPTTVEEFENTLIVFRDAYGTNPLFMDTGFNAVISGWYLPEGNSWWQDEQGVYLPPEMHPDFAEMLAHMHQWYKDGLIHQETFSGGNLQQLIEADKIGANIGWYSSTFPGTLNLRAQVPDAEFAYLQPLAGKYDNGYSWLEAANGYRVINVNSKNPEGVIAFYDWLCADIANMTIGRQGIEGVHFEYTDRDNHIIRGITGGDLNSTRYVPGTFGNLDIHGWFERSDTTDNPRLQWYYDHWDFVAEGKVSKTYVPLDYQYAITNALLTETSDLIGDTNTALAEAKIAFITGARSLSEWDAFIEEWKQMGMSKVIEEKNTIYQQKIK